MDFRFIRVTSVKGPSRLDCAKLKQCHAIFQVKYCNSLHRQLDIAGTTGSKGVEVMDLPSKKSGYEPLAHL